MRFEFRKVSDFDRGTLFDLLDSAYSYDKRFEEHFKDNWRECDDFFYDNLSIADSCCVVSCIEDKAIGFVSWDPRNRPDYFEIGHNCVSKEYKGMKYGKQQLIEAISRIPTEDIGKIIVTTNEALYAAQKNYESVGFVEVKRRQNDTETKFSGAYIDYELRCSDY